MTDEELVERRRAIDDIVPTDANVAMARAEEAAQKSISSSKEDLRAFYSNIGKVTNKNDGREVEFHKRGFDKNYRVGGPFAKAVPALKEVFENSILAYSEHEDKYAGLVRRDGTVHKAHPNYIGYHNYVGRVKIDGEHYYVRFTVGEEGKNKNALHSSFVSSIRLYKEKPTPPNLSGPHSLRGINPKEVVDTKLQDFFERAKKAEKKLTKNNGQGENNAGEVLYRPGDSEEVAERGNEEAVEKAMSKAVTEQKKAAATLKALAKVKEDNANRAAYHDRAVRQIGASMLSLVRTLWCEKLCNV